MRSETRIKAGHDAKAGAFLWTVQSVLAALFLFAGVMKLILPIQMMTAQSGLPGGFLRFIGVAESLGAIGLILPGLLRIRTGLTPLAAAGLALIMVGATVVTVSRQGPAPALFPFMVGVLATCVAVGRWRRAPLRRACAATPRPSSSAA